MRRLPTFFISHGSPMLAIQESPAHQFLQGLGETFPKPKAIVIASAHWETKEEPTLSFVEKPETIHDFGGFPRALFEIQYPASGAPEVAIQAKALLEQDGFTVNANTSRGLDHGAWVPLRLMYPQADIPITQVSIVRGAKPTEHLRLGQALSNLRDEGVLVIGSGSMTHNLYEFRGHELAASVPSWVSDFDRWMQERLEQNDTESLLDYRESAPFAIRNHPTEEHIAPLFIAMGASGEFMKAERIHSSYEYGVLAMDIYKFE